MSLEILTQPAQFNSTVSVLSSIKAATIELTNARAETLYNPATATGAFLLLSVNGVNKAIQLWDYVPQVLAIRYVGSVGDGDWSNPLNWTDAEGRSPATILPLGDFDVQIYADIADNTGNPAIARTYSFYDNARNYITLFAFSSFTFYNNSSNAGTLQGNVTFLDNSSNVNFYGTLGTVNGNANFYNNSTNNGIIQGNADVWYPVPSPLGGTVTGTITYHGYPVRFTNAAGDGDWSNLENWTDDVGEPATYLPTSAIDVKIYDKVTKVSQGEAIAHNASFFNTAALEQITLNVVNSAIFHDTTYNFGAIKGNAKFLDSSINGSLTQSIFFTPLHMHFNGTNGTQTFIDSSTYDHSITYGGEAYISTEHGVFGGPDDDPYNPPSLFLDGSSYIQSNPIGDEYKFGKNDFTIEFWVYPTANPSTSWTPILALGEGGGNSGIGQEIRIAQNIDNSGNVGFIIPNNTNNGDISLYSSNPLPLELWSHIALVRNNSTVTLYVNGFAVCTATGVDFDFSNSGPMLLGYGFYSFDGYFNGYIDELRIVNGKAIYTEQFNVPVQPLNNIDAIIPVVDGNAAFNNTSLNIASVSGNAIFNGSSNNGILANTNIANLTNGIQAYWKFEESNGNRIDISGNNNTITEVNGTIDNGAGVIGNSANITNGNNSWLKLPAGLCDVGYGQKSFSIWFKLNQTSVGYQWILMQGNPYDYNDLNVCYIESNSTLSCIFSQYGGNWDNVLSTNIVPTANEWHHVVLTFNGSTANLYYDGGLVASSTYYGYVQSSGTEYTLGHYNPYPNNEPGGQAFSGFIDELGVWNRELSSDEVIGLYNQRNGITYPFIQETKSGGVLGKATFNDSTKNANGFVTEGSFNGASINSSFVSTSATFTGTSQNIGTINTNAIFTDTATNGEFINTQLLMHFDDSYGSQNFVDSSSYNRSFSWDGYPFIDDGISRFGQGSLYLGGWPTHIYTDNTNYVFGSDDFTIEFWTYPNDYSYNISGWVTFISMGSQRSGGEIRIGYNINNSGNIGMLVPSGDGNGWVGQYTDSGYFMNPYQWYHVAMVRNGSNLTLYVNGQSVQTFTVGFNFTDTGTLKIGANSWSYNGDGFYNGWFDDIRIIKGKALYISNFTPPNAPLSILEGTFGNIGGNASFYGTSQNANGILYTADFHDYSFNNSDIYAGTFYGNSYNALNGLLLSASFLDYSINYGGILENGTIQAQARNYGYISIADVYYPAHYPLEGNYGSVTYHGYVFGCTDPNASNYNPNANTNDGSCSYPTGGLTENIFSYWKMDETTTGTRADATGNNNNLLDPNNNVTSVNGIVNSGAQFFQTYLQLN